MKLNLSSSKHTTTWNIQIQAIVHDNIKLMYNTSKILNQEYPGNISIHVINNSMLEEIELTSFLLWNKRR